MNIDEIFQTLEPMKRWVPYKLVYNTKREKFDKVPHNGRHGLKTSDESDWKTLLDAIAVVNDQFGLSGVGIVTTDGIEVDGWALVGFDFDDVTADFKLPFKTYAEKSPSKVGVRAFAWVPAAWVARYQDTLNCKPPHCDHCEIYMGTAPRFLTVTFDTLNNNDIAQLTVKDLKKIEGWGLHKRVVQSELPPQVDTAGSVLDLTKFKLTPDQKKLVEGEEGIDRSKTMMGFIIALLDGGASQEDVLATLLYTPTLWQYLMDHREGNEDRAHQFAKDEINRAYPKSMASKRAILIGFNRNWAPTPPKKCVAFPAPYPGPMADAVAAGLDAAHKPQPELTTMAALSAMAATCGSFYQQRDGSRLNLYFLGIAKTGTGKDLPLRLAKQLGRLGGTKLIGTPGSGQGLEDSLTSNIATYCAADEIAHFFSAMNDPRASSYERANARKLLELFSASSDEYETRALAGKEARVIQHPAFNLIGFTTPEKLGSAFHPDDFADGLAGRILFVFTNCNPTARRVCKPIELPASFKQVAMQVKNGLTFLLITGGIVIGITDDAEQMLDQLLTEFDQRGRAGDSPYENALYVRSLEKVERIAGVLAVWDNPAKPVISIGHIKWAAQFVRASNAAVLGFVEEHMHGGIEQENAASLMAMIRDGTTKSNRKGEIAASKAGWLPRSALLRRAKMDVQSFDRAIRNLSERGEIVVGPFENTKLQVIGLCGDD